MTLEEVLSDCWNDRVSREQAEKAIQALIDAAREEGRKEGVRASANRVKDDKGLDWEVASGIADLILDEIGE